MALRAQDVLGKALLPTGVPVARGACAVKLISGTVDPALAKVTGFGCGTPLWVVASSLRGLTPSCLRLCPVLRS